VAATMRFPTGQFPAKDDPDRRTTLISNHAQ
jgi:hypothetical protein